MALGEILIALREERKVKQKELATYLNVSVGTISNYEHNVYSPDLATLCCLADFFGVTADYLLGRTSYHFDPRLLNQRLSEEYTMTDLLYAVFELGSEAVDDLMIYARFLQSEFGQTENDVL